MGLAELFDLDFATGFVFGTLMFFAAYAFTATFKAFQVPGDLGDK